MQAQDDLVASAAYRPEPEAAAAARRFVRDTLATWRLAGPDATDLVDDAVLLTSELVTNAVVHAGTPVQVTCRLADSAVEVVVLDRHPVPLVPDRPQNEQAESERTSGRGLLLPAELASSWGVTYARTSKAVWFRLGLAGPGAPAPPAAGLQALPAGAALPAGEGTAGGMPAGVALPALPSRDLGRLEYEELLSHTVEAARAVLDADAAYLLAAGEDGELRMRAAAGAGQSTAAYLAQFASGPVTVAAGPAQALAEAAQSLVTVPLVADGQVTGLLAAVAAEPGQFRERDVARLQELADRAAPPLEQARLGEAERARSARARFLSEAAEVLSGQDSQQQIVTLTARLVVPQLADWCALLLPGPRGGLHPAYLVHADESRANALAWLLERARPAAETAGCAECGGSVPAGGDPTGHGITGSCAACQQGPVPWTRRPGLRWRLDAGLPGADWPDTAPPPGAAELAQDGAWCFPLVAGGHRLGLLVVGGVAGGRLPAEAAELAESLSRRAAMALDSSRRQARHRLPSRAPQPPSLPDLPTIPGVQLAAAHEQPGGGAEPGSGFHDVFPVGQGRWRFVLADVCGTGPEAAAVSGLTRHALRILAREGYGIAAVLQRLNGLILEEGDQARFVTLVHGEITTGSPARVELACAGHPQPLVLRAAGGPPETAADVQPLLGVIGGQSFVTSDLPLMAGDLLLTVTDGVTKRRDGYRLLDDAGGLAAIFAASRGQPAGGVAASIATAAREFGGAPLADDLALLVIAAAG